MKSEAMRLAAQYRGEGMDASESLVQAWQDIRDGDEDVDEDSFESESYDDSYDFDEDKEIRKPRKRISKREGNPMQQEDVMKFLLLIGAGIGIHRIASGRWFWQPAGTVNRVALQNNFSIRRVVAAQPAQPAAQPVQTEMDRQFAAKQAAGLGFQTFQEAQVVPPQPTTLEPIYFIYP